MNITNTILLLFFLALILQGCGNSKTIKGPDNWPPTVEAPVLGDDFDEGRMPSLSKSLDFPDQEKIYYIPTVYFDFDKAIIRPDMYTRLNDFIVKIRSKGSFVVIEGHCDERGSMDYNQILGQKRANAIKDLMITKGVSKHQIKSISKGKLEPISFQRNERSYAKNRRVEFEVSQ